MKLPDYSNFSPFLEAKRRMGISKEKVGDLAAIAIATTGISWEDLEAITEGGLDVQSLYDVKVNSDGTLSDKTQSKRVLLYIRDVSSYGFDASDPKFHFANCSTLQEMRTNNRLGRYVIAIEDTGEFTVYVGDAETHTRKRLNVCKNCLSYLQYEGYDRNWSYQRKNEAVSGFVIANFFTLYPKSLHHQNPEFDETNAPRNMYEANWSALSREVRMERGWKCEEPDCGVVLSSLQTQKYLQVHHLDGQKNKNARVNLRVLCVYCHAQQWQHSHMRNTSTFRDFERIRKDLLRS
jgi:hypothetical protein